MMYVVALQGGSHDDCIPSGGADVVYLHRLTQQTMLSILWLASERVPV